MQALVRCFVGRKVGGRKLVAARKAAAKLQALARKRAAMKRLKVAIKAAVWIQSGARAAAAR
jgi:hypothetical protein